MFCAGNQLTFDAMLGRFAWEHGIGLRFIGGEAAEPEEGGIEPGPSSPSCHMRSSCIRR